MAGFRSPLFVLGLSSDALQAGFRTPLPVFPAGAVVEAVQAGFRTALPLFPAGATADQPVILRRQKSGKRFYYEDEEILAVIMAIERGEGRLH